jgi:peptidoglycan/xylan/chitin deacetylase (PgdA/CDA1 family)
MPKKEILCAFSIHCDAVAGWLGSYGGEDSPGDISRGVFAAELGMPRLLNLFKRFGLKQSFFIPGHTIESFPKECQMVADAGHEIGLHGYSHENPLALTYEQESVIFDKSIALIKGLTGKRPTGYVAPWWEVSTNSIDILIRNGVKYDHSLMHKDFTPYYVRVGDEWTKIDYSQPAETWMKPFTKGKETGLVEIPASWWLDDLPPMMFIKKFPNSHGYVTPRDMESLWRDTFDWVYREHDYAVFPMTIHPDVSGRPQVLLMLERLIAYMMSQPGVRFVMLDEMADDFMTRVPPPKAAKAEPKKKKK